MGPPMLNVAATCGFFTCSPAGAFPRSCHAHHPSIGDSGGADEMALGDEPARGVDSRTGRLRPKLQGQFGGSSDNWHG